MTPEERKLATELFDRLATLEDAQRDPEAERLIKDGLRQAPNAPYALVQTVLVQDEALRRANARIRDLEGAAETPPRDASFLGGMRESLLGQRASRGSVPSVKPSSSSPGEAPAMSPAWRTGIPASAAGPAPAPMPAAPMPIYGPQTGLGGGSFLGTAASAAAGVIGGALLLDGIKSMMGHGGAHAAVNPGTHGALDSSAANPWTGNDAGGHLSHDAGLDDIGSGPAADPAPSRFLDEPGGGAQDVAEFEDADDATLDMDDGAEDV